MGNGKQETNKGFKWDATAFRRKCIRLIAYIIVFFMVLNRRLSVKRKKWLSVSFCCCVVAAAIVFSLAGQSETKMTGEEIPVVKVLSGNHNRVIGGRTEASIEMNRSRVIGDKSEMADSVSELENGGSAGADKNTDMRSGDRNHVAASDKPEDVSGEKPDTEVDEPEALSPVQALLENNGEDRQGEKVEKRYQYPVGIGNDEKNDGGVQSTADYIKKTVYKVDTDAEVVSPGAISPAGIQAEETSVSDLSQAEGDGKEESASDTGESIVSGAACSGVEDTGEKGLDTEDAVAPVMAFDEGGYLKIQGKDKTILCTNDNIIKVNASDDADGAAGTGVEKICYVYSDKLRYCIDPSQSTGLQVPDNFYGQIMANCFDAAGNRSDFVSGWFLIEDQAPQIRFSQDAFCTAPYTFWVDIGETGDVVSGIRDVTCTVDGKPYEITNLTMLENTALDEDLEVPTKCEFSIPFTEEGSYSVVVTVTDHAGNTSTEEKRVQVTKPELISVFMPEKFAIHIDPQRLAGREQIYSDDITLKNDSDFDVQVTVKNVDVFVKDEVSDTGIKKDCNVYMVAPDTGEKILLKKGENKEVYSYCLGKGEQDGAGKLRFVGDTTEGSDEMWRDSDVVIRVDLGFSKKEER